MHPNCISFESMLALRREFHERGTLTPEQAKQLAALEHQIGRYMAEAKEKKA